MSDYSFTARRAALGAAAAAALVVGAAPFALAQSADDTDLNTESIKSDSVSTESAQNKGGEDGSLNLESVGGEDGSLEQFVPDTSTKACDLPNMGGSVKNLIPYLGLNIPSFIVNIATQALDEIPNPLKTAGIDVHTLGLGSLEGPACSVIFGGKMTTITTTTSSSASGTTTSDAPASGTTTTTSSVPTSTTRKAGGSSLAGLDGILDGSSLGSVGGA